MLHNDKLHTLYRSVTRQMENVMVRTCSTDRDTLGIHKKLSPENLKQCDLLEDVNRCDNKTDI